MRGDSVESFRRKLVGIESIDAQQLNINAGVRHRQAASAKCAAQMAGAV